MLTSVRRALVALLLVAVGGVMLASPASATSQVSGTVVDPDGEPVSGAIYFYADGSGNGSGNSYSGGSFSVSGPADGDYQIQLTAATMDGYAIWYVAGQPNGTTTRALATTVHLDGSPVTLDPVQFPAIATLSGTVTDGDGQPVAGLTVGRNRLGSGSSTQTDSNGVYDFGYVLPGKTLLAVSGTATWASDRAQLTVGTSGDNVVDLVRDQPGHVVGQVTDADSGQPIPDIAVNAFERFGTDVYYVGQVTTDPAGDADVGGLSHGTYVLQYADPLGGYPTRWNDGALSPGTAPGLTVTVGATLTHDEALTQVADPRPGRSLSGVVTDPTGAPLVGVDVLAWGATGSLDGLTTSDRSGRWGLDVPDGDYLVSVQSGSWLVTHEAGPPWFPEYFPDAWGPGAATTIAVAGDTHPGLDMSLARAGRLRLDVRGPGSSTDLNAGYRVVAAADGSVVDEHVPTPFDGHQLAVLVRPGSWKVLVTGRGGLGSNDVPLLAQWYGGGASLGQAAAVDFVAGTDIDGGTLALPARLRATIKPRVKGKPKVGKKLRATSGTWNLMTDTSMSYRWLRGGKVVGKRHAYRVRKADAGRRLVVKVTARNGGLATTVKIRVRVR